MPVISATLERLRQEDGKFETSVRNITRSCQKKKPMNFLREQVCGLGQNKIPELF
jgi:hypothetical protein